MFVYVQVMTSNKEVDTAANLLTRFKVALYPLRTNARALETIYPIDRLTTAFCLKTDQS